MPGYMSSPCAGMAMMSTNVLKKYKAFWRKDSSIETTDMTEAWGAGTRGNSEGRAEAMLPH